MKTRPIFERKNVLVTGGAGFIGSHLCDELIKTAKVICVDNFVTGSEENINHLLRHPDFEFVRHDLTEPLDLDVLPELKPFKIPFQGIQEIYHLACPTSPKDYNRAPIETLLANSHATKNALDLAVKHQAKFILTSTSAIYGEPQEDTPYPENYWGFVDPVGPRSCYNEGKRFAESLVANYRQHHGIDAKIARIFNTYGPRMKLSDGRMIADFVANALQNKDVVIYGGQKDVSTFCFISDTIDALVRLMRSADVGPMNIGNPEPHEIADVAQRVITFLTSTSKIRFESALPYTVRQGIPNIHVAKEKLGWFPVVGIDEGLRRTIDAMRGTQNVRFDSFMSSTH